MKRECKAVAESSSSEAGDSRIMRQRSRHNGAGSGIPSTIVVSSTDHDATRLPCSNGSSGSRTPLVLKKKKSTLLFFVKKLASVAWLGFGLYGVAKMTGNLKHIAGEFEQGQRDHHVDRQHLRKTLMLQEESDLKTRINKVLNEDDGSGGDENNAIEVPDFEDEEMEVEEKDHVEQSMKSEKEPSKQVEAESALRKQPNSVIAEDKNNASPPQQQSFNTNVSKPSKPKKTNQDNKDSSASSFAGIPNVLLVGAQKSGTTALASWIFKHECVCKPVSATSGESMKEVHFFDLKDDMYSKGVNYYKKHFVHCAKENVKQVLDATPDYLRHADRVYKTYDEVDATDSVKIIMILREPVDREYSWYHHMASEITRNAEPRPYTETVLDEKRKLQRFEKYATNTVLSDLDNSYGLYSKWLGQWMKYFDRKQILVLSYDELKNDQKSIMYRLQQFLDLPSDPKEVPQEIVKLNGRAASRVDETPSCAAHSKLAQAFDPYNKKLYKLLEEHPGPEAEQRPFPKFQFAHCRKEAAKRDEEEEKEKKRLDDDDNWDFKAAAANPPTTVFFATHHKTGTDISRAVASLLQEQGMVSYSSEWLNDNDLFKDGNGDQLKCTGSTTKPEVRSYNQWPKWIIDTMWSKCVGAWWDKWPAEDSSTDILFQKCMSSEADALKKQLKWASCDNEHLVVHFVRNPIDLILSSYRYTKLGKEDWMHKKVGSHPKFKPEHCGEHNCKGMTIHEAVRDLPAEVGLQLEMHLVSMEIVKQMMVASAFAKLDPEHHITVSLSEIMESSESFNRSWTKIMRGVFPTKSTDSIQKIVGKLKKFDMNSDPENFAGRSHSTIGRTSKAETEKHTNTVLSDGEVKFMLEDPLVKSIV